MSDFEFPTETIDIPSRGWFYDESSPLSSGQIELHYMTAKHENILTSRNLMMKGTVVEKLLDALIATPGVKVDDLLLGDKNAIFVAARIMGYGKDYKVNITCPSCKNEEEVSVDLEELGEVDFDFDKYPKGRNEFEYVLPIGGQTVSFKLLTSKDEQMVNKELERIRKAVKNGVDPEITTRLRSSILSVDGDRDRTNIAKFVDNMLARDSRAYREFSKTIMPNVDFTFSYACSSCDYEGRLEVPIDHTFLWPKL